MQSVEAEDLEKVGATDATLWKTCFDSMHSSCRSVVNLNEKIEAFIDICDWPLQVLGIKQTWLCADHDQGSFVIDS